MKIGSLIVAIFSLLAVAATARAAADGGELFKRECGSCHVKGGLALPINPGEKAGSVWVKYFARDRHPVKLSISDADMAIILLYLEGHAADSDRPEMLAIPK